ncbi:LytR/AlgR family response regulator transcription factor [Flavobacterium pectinovorum]|uniref:LytR/AlgR family response regulator transcription factor n=1 Tax=Flavobacterium pectinovorum TaxID=29533 RepID=UPI001FABC6AD|nr:LytTR family DNA-binding domain-containing protein [Flavobacterium pectinovorum]MCI9843928.1 response regulator transcription factor [Flavobacterium pectinovorum]
MEKIKTLIVDDEPNARSLLHNFIEEYCPEIELIGEAENVKSAVKIINNNDIDLVFLDVEMPNENGFALFEYFNKPNFETIFCTAYSQYAIRAFEVSAVDYILKPVSIAKLKEAIEKVAEKRNRNTQTNNIAILKENLLENQIRKIGIHIGDGIVFMDINDIFYFEADSSYTTIHHKKGKDLVVKKIKHFENLLSSDTRFFRIHRSYFVNITLIKKYSKKDGLSITYDDKILLPVSREKKEEFEDFMQMNNIV